MRIGSRVLCLLFLVVTLPLAAQNSGPASNGDFRISAAGITGTIQYTARLHGSDARGEMTFTGTTEISNQDVDGAGSGTNAASSLTLEVSFDCLRISGNRAAMSGIVTSSTVPEYVGARALLAVEDNGEGVDAPEPDKFTWGLYRTTAITWVPSDAEVPDDRGATLTWLATDAERSDDKGVSSRRSTTINCETFPFGSYVFQSLAHGAGQIQVKP
jgi:hypothetical protein